MGKNQIFRVNSPQIVCETIDGEVVIVNLDKGYYYSLLKTGADIWSSIEQQIDHHSLVQKMTQTYAGSAEEITAAIDEFLATLQQEQIIIAEPMVESADLAHNPTEIAEISDKPSFEKPMLEKFTDMEDLLLLDPIHEVDVEAGWPNAKVA